MYKFGPVQQKMLLLLVGGLTLSLQTSSYRYYKLLFALRKEWKKIDQRSVSRSLQRLVEQKLVKERILPNGSINLVLTKEGKRQARLRSLLGNSIRFKSKKRWDKKWRVVLFDIPEKNKTFRDILRDHLRDLRFFKLQQSVFVSPYSYEKPLEELVELYGAEPYVRILTVERIDNDTKLKKFFFSSTKNANTLPNNLHLYL